MENKQWGALLWYFLIILWIIILFQSSFLTSYPVNIAYSDFVKLLKADKLDNVLLGENHITANVKTEQLDGILPKDKLSEIKTRKTIEQAMADIFSENIGLICDVAENNNQQNNEEDSELNKLAADFGGEVL